MSKYIQPISHSPPHKGIKRYCNDSDSNLTEGSAQSRLEAEVVEEGAKVCQNIIWL